MENASKALIMAGSVLISMLIIGALVFMFNSISELKTTEATSEEAQKLAEYNKQIETFNRDLYGSEIFSLANLIDDYNQRQHELKGYKDIELIVTINSGSSSYEAEVYYFEDLQRLQNAMEDEIDETLKEWRKHENTTIKINDDLEVTIKNLATMNDTKRDEFIRLANIDGTYNTTEQNKLDRGLEAYTNYIGAKSEMTNFKNKKFSIDSIEYDEYTGRVRVMKFEEE